MTSGRRTNLSRVGGFTWVLEWDQWGNQLNNGPYSEVVFSTLSPPSALGGTYYIEHDSDTGRWFAYEMGGAGPMIWENDISYGVTFPSPLAAMMTIRRLYNKEMREQERVERELEKFAEEERARGYEKARQDAQQDQYHMDLEAKDWDGL